jgi:hypothetical protein
MKRRIMLALSAGGVLCMAAIGRPALGQQNQRVIEQTNYWALPAKADEVCRWRNVDLLRVRRHVADRVVSKAP